MWHRWTPQWYALKLDLVALFQPETNQVWMLFTSLLNQGWNCQNSSRIFQPYLCTLLIISLSAARNLNGHLQTIFFHLSTTRYEHNYIVIYVPANYSHHSFVRMVTLSGASSLSWDLTSYLWFCRKHRLCYLNFYFSNKDDIIYGKAVNYQILGTYRKSGQ